MEFTGRIHIRELERKAVEVKATEADTWIQSMLALAAPETELTGLSPEEWAKRSKFSTELRIEKMNGDYIVSGKLEAKLQNPCSRCSDLFSTPRESQFQFVLHPMAGRREAKQDEDSGDADYVFFQSDYVNLVELLAEQLIVLEPVAEAPPRKESGDCTLCGLNPQFAVAEEVSQIFENTAGQEVENKAFSAFSVLGQIKGQTKK